LDLPQLPGPLPLLHLSLALKCGLARCMLLVPDQHGHVVLFGEPGERTFAMHPDAAHKIIGHANVERAVALACEHVDVVRHRLLTARRLSSIRSYPLRSSPRRRRT